MNNKALIQIPYLLIKNSLQDIYGRIRSISVNCKYVKYNNYRRDF